MLKHLKIFMLSGLFLLTVVTGCSSQAGGVGKVPSISGLTGTAYETTMEELGLGYAFDYSLNTPKGFTGQVKLWAETYDEGVRTDHGGMSYGWEPELLPDDRVGFVLLRIDDKPRLMYHGSGGALRGSSELPGTSYTFAEGAATWEDLAEKEPLPLTMDVPQVVAVYQANRDGTIRTVDYRDPAQLEEMIQANDFVVLFKVELGSGPLGAEAP